MLRICEGLPAHRRKRLPGAPAQSAGRTPFRDGIVGRINQEFTMTGNPPNNHYGRAALPIRIGLGVPPMVSANTIRT
jgi:hypothetical protein